MNDDWEAGGEFSDAEVTVPDSTEYFVRPLSPVLGEPDSVEYRHMVPGIRDRRLCVKIARVDRAWYVSIEYRPGPQARWRHMTGTCHGFGKGRAGAREAAAARIRDWATWLPPRTKDWQLADFPADARKTIESALRYPRALRV